MELDKLLKKEKHNKLHNQGRDLYCTVCFKGNETIRYIRYGYCRST